MDCSLPGSSVHGFPRQEYWSGLPFSSPEDLPDPGIEPTSPSPEADCLPSEPPGKLTFMKEVAKTVFMRLCYSYKIFLSVIKVSSPLVLI